MTKKRFRAPIAKEGELLAKYGKDDCGDNGLLFCYPSNECGMSRDSKMLMLAFERTRVLDDNSLVQELINRGYDITTLKFSIKKK